MKSIFLIIGGMWLVALVGIGGLSLFAPDLAVRLRSQVAPVVEGPSAITKELSWTPTADTALGDYRFTVIANDGVGGRTTQGVVITVTAPAVCEDVRIHPQKDSASIKCRTAKPAKTPRIQYDVNDSLQESVEVSRSHEREIITEQPVDAAPLREWLLRSAQAQTATESTEHEIVLTNLLSCTTYYFQFIIDTAATGPIHTFTTTGCSGDAPVKGTAAKRVPAGTEDTVELADKAKVRVPSNALAADTSLQIQQLDRDTAITAIGVPQTGLSPVTGLYQLTAYTDPATIVSSFSEPLTVTLAYTPAAGTDLSTLALWRHDGTSWSALNDCAVDESAQTVSCTTTQFSAVAGFATGGSSGDEEPEPTPEPEPQPQQASSGGSSGGDGGGDGGSGSGGEESGQAPESAPGRAFIYQAEQGWSITGRYSGVQGGAVKMAGNRDLLSRTITAPADDYYVYLKARHDRPGPVQAAVYLAPRGGQLKAWKVVKLDKNDDQYYTHRLGQLAAKDFPGGVYQVAIRLLNDAYDKANPGNEATDRNLWVDWVILANQPSLSGISVVDRSAAGGPGAAAPSSGRALLPRLNTHLRAENIPVTLDNWKYYAWRLTRPPSDPAAIGDEAKLRAVMRYWRAANPNQPRGEVVN